MAPIDVEQAIRDQAPNIAKEIQAAAEAHPGDEANFRRKVERLVEDFAEAAGVQHDPRHEYTLFNGRADSVYNRLVIEYEPPGSIRQSNTYRSNKHAIDQVKGYVEGLSRRERHKKERIAGVVLDGHWLIFIRHKDERWEIDDPVPVAAESTERFLRYLNSLSTELAVTPENLIRDFGDNTRISRPCVSRLYQALVSTDNPRVRVLFEQWSLQFSEICGYEPGSSRLDVRKLAESYGVKGKDIDPFRLFFAIHTYYATFIKLLAVQIASFYAFPKLGTGLQQVANCDSDRLRDYLAKMERGGIFKDFGISNFLEGDFFVWYLDVWNEEMDDAIRRVVARLSEYSLVTLDVDPDNTRDLLKRLYQNLMPKALRHDLGEYYTPDWLAERLLNQLGYTEGVRDLPQKRILDPACGSGTFLVLAIKRVRQWANAQATPVNEADLLDRILNNVVGFDLNPLAVISARTNYLLALGDLLQHRRGDISIPVYLADSILTPSVATDAGGQLVMGETSSPALSFGTSVGRFSVPQTLVTAQYIDQLADLLEECVAARYPEDGFRRRLLSAFPLDEAKDAAAIEVASGLFRRLAELEQQGINGIWARIIKNAFAPLFCGQFDYVAGNPPWVGWEHLPDGYRSQLVPLNHQTYRLFPHKGLAARHGASEVDLSTLMTYVSCDRYLRPKGRLGFVITQTVFQTTAGQGFRRFGVHGGADLCVLHVDDMTPIKPFEGAQNRTAVVVMEKGRRTQYPVQYTYWRRSTPRKAVPMDASLPEASELTRRSQWVATPIDESNSDSPWLTGRRQAVLAARRMASQSAYTAHKGIDTCGANGVYWVDVVGQRPPNSLVVCNQPDVGRKALASVQAAVEADAVYPMLRGRDVQPWHASPGSWLLVPQDPDDPKHGMPEDRMLVAFPQLHAFLSNFRDFLAARVGYRKYLAAAGEPWYSLYDIKDYTFAPHKVVWREQSALLTCAVINELEGKPVVPDHKLILVSCDSAAEAHYICACLQSAPARYLVRSYSIETQISTHILQRIPVERYSAAQALHRDLASCSLRAHRFVQQGRTDEVAAVEAEIDQLAAQLWGLSDTELKDIQDSLADLKS